MFKPSGYYLLRTPHYSINQLLVLNKYISNQQIDLIKKTFDEPLFLSAIALSSNDFYNETRKWIDNPSIEFDIKDKILLSLYKYYIRICSRSTPYGLFAGFSMGNLTNKTSKFKFDAKPFTPLLRADMLFLKTMKDMYLNNKTHRVTYFLNNTIYKVNENYRYIEWDKNYNYQISEIENNPILEVILKMCIDGVTIPEILTQLKDKSILFDEEELEIYVYKLVDCKILIDDLPPYTTGIQDPLTQLIDSLDLLNIDNELLKQILSFQHLMNEDFNAIQLNEFINNFTRNSTYKNQLFQVDLRANFTVNRLDRKVVEELTNNVYDLSHFVNDFSSQRINDFQTNFYRRYEAEEVPLIEALDPQIGIGYGYRISGNVEQTPLLRDLHFSYSESSESLTIPSLVQLIIDKYDIVFKNQPVNIIVLDEKDIKIPLKEQTDINYHDDYYLFGDLLATSIEHLNKGEYKFMNKSMLPSPLSNTILSRFSYHDKALATNMNKNLSTPKHSIYAEIIHNPNDRTGNILLRPNMYDFEIAYVNESAKDKTRIDINDIMVSIQGDEIVLRSKRFNRIVVPRLSTAYNYNNNQLSFIQFLGDFQFYKKFKGFEWDWSVLNNRTYLPRVEYKKIILTEARWKIDKNKEITISVLKQLINLIQLPQYCNHKQTDNVLFLDTKNDLCLNYLCHQIKKNDVYLYESFHDLLFVKNNEQFFFSEFIFPFKKIDSDTGVSHSKVNEDSLETKRMFLPGSEWTYFKIYCSHSSSDLVLTNSIVPLIDYFKINNPNIQWFFIRYEDPDHHIRFRIKMECTNEHLVQINHSLHMLIESGHVYKVQLDTYKQEIERYGSNNISFTEKLFYYDSQAIVNFLTKNSDAYDTTIRWKIGIISIDLLLDNFNISLNNRIKIIQKLYDSFLLEFVDTRDNTNIKLFKKSIDKKLRTNKGFLENALLYKEYDEEFTPYISPFLIRSLEVNSVIQFDDNYRLNEEELDAVMGSYLHMNLNRLFQVKARMHELVIYFMVLKTYKSIAYRYDQKGRN